MFSDCSMTFVFIDIIYLHNKVLPHYVSSPLNKYLSLWLGWFSYVWDTYLEDIADISGFPCYTVYYCILLTGDYYGGEYFVLPRTASGVNTCAVRTNPTWQEATSLLISNCINPDNLIFHA